MQGFKFANNNEFIVKEAVLAREELDKEYHWLFDPPCSKDNLDFADWTTVNWLQSNHRGLSWNDGSIPYAGVSDHFKHTLIRETDIERPTKILVMGSEKKQWLKALAPKFFSTRTNIEITDLHDEYDIDSSDYDDTVYLSQWETCPHHDAYVYRCTLRSVFFMHFIHRTMYTKHEMSMIEL
ncbi:hypothetical protein QAD02_007159 [Eretmocerus hayati]|uniref:Uncharacterized protein n=1 Tax=Eretmocerus hayati TaxID=131215 RepID=A0ACC2N380_9HYME|nr:hypothetical protein QAD02_007159 [Eretmocerus hayati]